MAGPVPSCLAPSVRATWPRHERSQSWTEQDLVPQARASWLHHPAGHQALVLLQQHAAPIPSSTPFTSRLLRSTHLKAVTVDSL